MQIGWNMVIETTNGIVGLWTCWLGTSIKLFYPLEINIPDEIIMKILEVNLAKPVKNDIFGTRLWAKYYSEKLEDCGRVWIDKTSDHSNGYNLYKIENEQLIRCYCGHNHTNTIWTYNFNFYSESEPEAPNCEEKNIQEYKEKFIKLLVEIAKLVGDIKAINLDSELVLYTPEILSKKGYKLKNWKDGKKEYYYTKNDNYEIILKSGNSLVSWSTIIRYPATNELTAEGLIKLVDSYDNSEEPYDLFPLFLDLCEKVKRYNY